MNSTQLHTNPSNPSSNRYFNVKNVKIGIILFLGITILGYAFIFFNTNTGISLNAIKRFEPEFFVILIMLVFGDWWFGAYRNHIFVKKLIPGISLSVTFVANLSNIFMGAVTPSQTGGGPMHLYMLNRKGVKVTDGIAISIINFISTMLFLIISTGIALYFLRNNELGKSLSIMIHSGFALFSILFILLAIGLIAPSLFEKWITALGGFFIRISKKKGPQIEKYVQLITSSLYDYNQTVSFFLRKNPAMMLSSLLLTMVLFINKYIIGYFILLAMGYEADFWMVIALHALITFLLYFAPSPGASGLAEISIAVLMGQIIPVTGLATFTILQRFFTLILPASIGAIFVFKEFGKHTKELSSTPPSIIR